ncbi:unnamed protein product [Cylicocyclus nassatus]|uniref:Molybdenum cofactor sulfurase middle domain-containing protein n=1 Tax=Cylicocyclus nassatus TaxID=53992 RepID=A0AA36GTF6_CYLNA|nr:unnamed protein product [Cylicocyclus nassatus]
MAKAAIILVSTLSGTEVCPQKGTSTTKVSPGFTLWTLTFCLVVTISMWQERRALVAAGVGAFVLVYCIIKHYKNKAKNNVIPIGVVKELYVYPIKSCKGISVFSIFCHPLGPVSGENFDRFFIVIDGKTGRFYTARRSL